MMSQKQILLFGLLACSMHHMYSADNETLTAAMTPSYRQDRRLSIDETSNASRKNAGSKRTIRVTSPRNMPQTPRVRSTAATHATLLSAPGSIAHQGHRHMRTTIIDPADTQGTVVDLANIDFNDSENPPLVTIPLTDNDTSHVDDILAQYPALAQDPEVLAEIRAHLASNPRLIVQSPTARTTRRINFFKYNTGNNQHAAQLSSQQQPDDQKNSDPASTDSEKTIENPAPHSAGINIVGNAIITTLMARHTTSSRQQTKKTYLTGAVGLIATAACGLMVRYLDNQCS